MDYWILHSIGTSKSDLGLVFVMGSGRESSGMEPTVLPLGMEPGTGK